MRRAAVVLGLLALALPMAAWADSTLTITNKGGNFNITGMSGTDGAGTIGVSTLSTVGQGSTMQQYGSVTGNDLGKVFFSTGALETGTVFNGGTFSSAGSTFYIEAGGTWSKGLTPPAGPRTLLFSGTFTGNVDWTLTSVSGKERFYTLTGDIEGVTYNGETVTGTVTENFYTYNGTLMRGGGYITFGTTTLNLTPEPGTLALLGTGLVGIAGMFRRRLHRS